MKNGPQKDTKFHGILAIGSTMEEAANRYRLLAMGKGATVKVDKARSIAFVTTAGDAMPELFNPMTGNLDLRESKKVLNGLTFEAKAGDADVEANHYVCTAGCSQHIVYDSAELLKSCPVCTASVASEEEDQADGDDIADDAELNAEEQDDEEDAEDDDLDADTDPDLDDEDDEDDDSDDADDSDEDDSEDDSDEDDSAEASDDECGDDCPGCPQCDAGLDDDDEDDTSESSADTRPLLIAAATKAEAIAIFKRERRQSATASAGAADATVDVNYMVCSSAGCGAHVLAEQDGVTDCPSCKSTLIEPAAETAAPVAAPATVAPVVASGAGIVRVVAEAGDDEDDEDDEDEDDDLSVVDEEDEGEDEDEEDDESAEASASAAPVNAKTRKLKVKINPQAIATASAADADTTAAPAAPVAAAAPAPVVDGAAASAPAIVDEGQAAAPAAVVADSAPVIAEPAAVAAPAPVVEAAPAVVVTPPVVDTEAVVVNMLDTLPDDATAAKLDVSLASVINGQPLWTAFYEGTPVATARAADAGKNADMFDKANFGHAVIAGAKHIGVKAILTEMGFKPVTCTAHIPTIINEKVAAQVAEVRAEVETERAEHAERFMAGLASAAIGINRGFFTELENPVKKALWNAMASAGIKNPEVLIDQAFRESGDAYHKTLFAKANDIISKPPEVQESLAKAILGTSYMGVAQASAGAPALEDRLANMGTVTAGAETAPAAPAPVAAAPAGNSQITAVVAGLGRRHR